MKRIASLMIVVAAFAVLATVGCKTRDAKKLALALGPDANPCNITNFVGTITPKLYCTEIEGSTAGLGSFFFSDYCYNYNDSKTTNKQDYYGPKHEAVYSFVVTSDDNIKRLEGLNNTYSDNSAYVEIGVYNRDASNSIYEPAAPAVPSDKFVYMEIRSSCEPSPYNDNLVGCNYGYNSTYWYGGLRVGTYYLAVYSYDPSMEDGWDSALNYGLSIYNSSSDECDDERGTQVKLKLEKIKASSTPVAQ